MILDEIAAATRLRVEQLQRIKDLNKIRSDAESLPKNNRGFRTRLSRDGMNFITEVKKASPSKGIISKEFDYLRLARDYEAAGAAAISCLTEPQFFLGKDEYLQAISTAGKLPVLRKDFTDIRAKVDIPMLRKDFIFDEYQIYEAKTIGADAVLLICALLETSMIREFLDIAASVGLDVLVEAHDESEVESALNAGAEIIGVNNRNLKDFSVDLQNSLRLRSLVPRDKIFVSESGITCAADIKLLRAAGVNGFLIGEMLMRSNNITLDLQRLSGEIND